MVYLDANATEPLRPEARVGSVGEAVALLRPRLPDRRVDSRVRG